MSTYHDPTGLTYWMAKLKRVLDKTFLKNPVEGDLHVTGGLTVDKSSTVKGNQSVGGDLTVNGNSTINRSLTVESIHVTDKMTIGEYDPTKPDNSNFVDKDALQKIQDQIISPQQDIFIDSVNGHDDTGDGTASKPFATIAKAKTIMRDANKVVFKLVCNKPDQIYFLDPIDFKYRNVQTFKLEATPWTQVSQKGIRPTVYVGYGKLFAEDYTGTTKYFWGNFVAGNINRVEITGISLQLYNEHEGNNFSNFVVLATDLYTLDSVIKLGTHDLWKPRDTAENKILLAHTSFANDSTGFIATNEYKAFADEPLISTANTADVENNNTVVFGVSRASTGNLTVRNNALQVSSSMYTTYVDGAIPNTMLAKGNKGYSANIEILYKNWE